MAQGPGSLWEMSLLSEEASVPKAGHSSGQRRGSCRTSLDTSLLPSCWTAEGMYTYPCDLPTQNTAAPATGQAPVPLSLTACLSDSPSRRISGLPRVVGAYFTEQSEILLYGLFNPVGLAQHRSTSPYPKNAARLYLPQRTKFSRHKSLPSCKIESVESGISSNKKNFSL